jgi:hypothetical protein
VNLVVNHNQDTQVLTHSDPTKVGAIHELPLLLCWYETTPIALVPGSVDVARSGRSRHDHHLAKIDQVDIDH